MAPSKLSDAKRLEKFLRGMEKAGEITTGDVLPQGTILASLLGLSTKQVAMAALELEIYGVVENVNRRLYWHAAPQQARNAQQVLVAMLRAISTQELRHGKPLPPAPIVSKEFGISVSSYYDQVLGRLAEWEIVQLASSRPAVLASGCVELAQRRQENFCFSKLAHITLAENLLRALIIDLANRDVTLERWCRQETDWDNRQLATKVLERFRVLALRKSTNARPKLRQASPTTFATRAVNCLAWLNRHYRLVPSDVRQLAQLTA